MSSKCIVLVQSKWIKSGSGCPDKSGAIKFCTGVRDLLALRRSRFRSITEDAWIKINDALHSHGLKVVMCLIYTGGNEISEHVKNEVETLLESINEGTPIISFEAINRHRIYDFLASDGASEPIDLDLSFSNWGVIQNPHCSYYGVVSGSELGKLWLDHGDRLFRKNLRRKLKSPINDQIARTSIEEPSLFWYFNNGVTIICDKLVKAAVGGGTREVGLFRASNAAVVNGAQTVSAIGSMAGAGHDVSGAMVFVRIIEIGPEGDVFGDRVTQYNNYQNKIEPRDLMAQEENQRRLRKELSFAGFEYKLQRGEYINQHEVIDFEEATIALACCSGDIALATTAKRETGLLWSQMDNYRKIFNPSLSGNVLVFSVIFSRMASTWLDAHRKLTQEEIDHIIITHGNRYMLFFMYEHARQRSDLKKEMSEFNAALLTIDFFQATGGHLLQLMREFITKAENRHMITLGFKNLNFLNKLHSFCVENFGKSKVLQQGLLEI